MSTLKILGNLIKIDLAINRKKSVLVSEENKYIRFQNLRRFLKVPFIIYADFESISKPLDNKSDRPNNEKCQDHIICSYGHKIVWGDEHTILTIPY